MAEPDGKIAFAVALPQLPEESLFAGVEESSGQRAQSVKFRIDLPSDSYYFEFFEKPGSGLAICNVPNATLFVGDAYCVDRVSEIHQALERIMRDRANSIGDLT